MTVSAKVSAQAPRLLVSDALRDQLPDDLDAEVASELDASAISVVIAVQVGDTQKGVAGILRSVLFEKEPEVELRVTVDDALAFVSAANLRVINFELQTGDRTIKVDGPFSVKGARIDDISIDNQLCTLSVGMQKSVSV